MYIATLLKSVFVKKLIRYIMRLRTVQKGNVALWNYCNIAVLCSLQVVTYIDFTSPIDENDMNQLLIVLLCFEW